MLRRKPILRQVAGTSVLIMEVGASLAVAPKFVASGPDQLCEALEGALRVVQKDPSSQYSPPHQTLCTEGASSM